MRVEQAEREKAISAATRNVGWTFGLVWLLSFAYCLLLITVDIAGAIRACTGLTRIALIGAVVVVYTGEIIGWIAFLVVRSSSIRATRMAVILAWVFNLSIFGRPTLIGLMVAEELVSNGV